MKILFERSHIQDLIFDGCRAVNDKLDGRLLSLDLCFEENKETYENAEWCVFLPPIRPRTRKRTHNKQER